MAEFGTVKWFNRKRDFGFAVSDWGNEVYLNKSQIETGTTLETGMRIEFEPQPDAKRGTQWAKNIKVVSS